MKDANRPALPIGAWASDLTDLVLEARKVSMLREDALALLAKLAARASGPIIEIGSYVGGSTIALASEAQHQVYSIEPGGSNPDHPHLPTSDIVADARANIERCGLADKVRMIVGGFRDEATHAILGREIVTGDAGMLFIDADPGSELALQTFVKYLRPDAFVVLDDYVSEEAVEKSSLLSRYVDDLVEHGALESFGVHGWGTWFGRLLPDGARIIQSTPGPNPFRHLDGHAYWTHCGYPERGDNTPDAKTSPLVLFEDGNPLGPAHASRDDVKALGLGRYNHYYEHLVMAASDNSDPRTNGRRYHFEIDGKAEYLYFNQ